MPFCKYCKNSTATYSKRLHTFVVDALIHQTIVVLFRGVRKMKMIKSMNCRLYRIWYSMKARCYRQSHNRYNLYGGRGIKVCDKWQAYEGFF